MRAVVEERRRARAKADSVASGSVVVADAPPPAAPAADPLAAVPDGKVYVAKPTDKPCFSQKEASEYLPPNSFITRGSAREAYWQVRRGDGSFSRSKRVDETDPSSDWSCMVFCILSLWRNYETRDGLACPFAFEASIALG